MWLLQAFAAIREGNKGHGRGRWEDTGSALHNPHRPSLRGKGRSEGRTLVDFAMLTHPAGGAAKTLPTHLIRFIPGAEILSAPLSLLPITTAVWIPSPVKISAAPSDQNSHPCTISEPFRALMYGSSLG